MDKLNIDENFWLKTIRDPDKLLFSNSTIEKFNMLFNENIFKESEDQIPEFNIKDILKNFKPKSKNFKIETIEEELRNAEPVDEYALTVNFSNIRSLPTDVFFYSQGEPLLDRLQESGIEIGEAVRLILKGKKWAYVKTPFYRGWIKLKDIAVGKKDEIIDFLNSKEFYVVLGSYAYTMPSIDKKISMKLFRMGTKIAKGIFPYNNLHIDTLKIPVKIPVKSKGLHFENAFFSHREDISFGYLKPTRRNILKTALKLVNIPYGWGDSFFAFDCSSTVRSIYKTIGIYLPRNTSQQENVTIGKRVDFTNKSIKEKLEILNEFDLGDLLFMKGHVMMYFGKINGVHYIFHNFHKMFLNGTIVSVDSALITPIDIQFDANRSAISEIRTGIIMEE